MEKDMTIKIKYSRADAFDADIYGTVFVKKGTSYRR